MTKFRIAKIVKTVGDTFSFSTILILANWSGCPLKMFTPKTDISRLFRYAQSELAIDNDEFGFVVPSENSLKLPHVLSYPAALIRGQPWTGKTHIANELYRQLQLSGSGPFVWQSRLHRHSYGTEIKPGGWDKWLNGSENAFWVVDSVDEGEIIQANLWTQITELLDSAGESGRERLRILLFCRESDLPSGLCETLDQLYARGLGNFELLPLDKLNAQRIVSDERFQQTLEAVTRYSLQAIVRYPAALQYIANASYDESLSEVSVWRGVLQDLLQEKNLERARKNESRQEVEHQFRAAAHLAVIMTFSEISHLAPEGFGQKYAVTDLITADPSRGGPMRSAARDALKTAMFTNGRFAQKNIQEWMCAFGLSEIGRGRLKPLVTDMTGELQRQHSTVLSLLCKTTTFKKDVADWLIEKNNGVPIHADVALSLSDALRTIDRLETLADSTPWNASTWGSQGLKQLKTPGIGKELAMRISDKSRSANCRQLLLQIAKETSASDVVPTALDIVCDESDNDLVRQTALFVMSRVGSDEAMHKLSEFVQQAKPKTRIEIAVIAAIIRDYLESGFWSVEQAVLFAPDPHNDVIDSTHVLISKLCEAMTVEAARILVKTRLSASKLYDSKKVKSRGGRRDFQLMQTAVQTLLRQEPPNDADLSMLIPLALSANREIFERMENADFLEAYSKSTKARREIYLEQQKQNALEELDERRTRDFGWTLQPEDVEWLMERCEKLAAVNDEVWNHLLAIAGRASESTKRLAREFVRNHDKQIVESFDMRQKAHEQWLSKHRAKVEQEEREYQKEQIRIEAAVDSLMSSKEVSLQEQMWQLSMVCLSVDDKPHNIVGNWEDLSDEKKSAVLAVCEKALIECNPTEIPEASTFPARIMYEAWCFRSVVIERSNCFKLTAELIQKWLPSIFFVTVPGEEHVVAACMTNDPDATESIVLHAIERELRRESEHLITALNLKQECWSQKVTKQVVSLIKATKYSAKCRADLFRILASRDPESATTLAQKLYQSNELKIAHASVDILLRYDIELAWPIVCKDFADRGKQALLDLPSLYHDRYNRISFDSEAWPASRLVELTHMLHEAFPPKDDPKHGGFVTPEHEFSDIRASIPRILFERATEEDRGALEELTRAFPYLKEWYQHVCAQEAADGLIGRVAAPNLAGSTEPPPNPFKVKRLLENADFRIIRNDDDLLDVLVDLLENRIGCEAGTYAEMLYYSDKESGTMRRLHESALQSYVACRLNDLLPGRILDDETVIIIHREPQGRFRQRTDIRVDTPLANGGVGSVIIEVKWSDNKDRIHNVSTGLTVQLGNEYLIKNGKMHGIFLVGWNGTLGRWNSSAGKRPTNPVTIEQLKKALDAQARLFSESNDGFRVKPVLINLEWPARLSKGNIT